MLPCTSGLNIYSTANISIIHNLILVKSYKLIRDNISITCDQILVIFLNDMMMKRIRDEDTHTNEVNLPFLKSQEES